MLFRLRPLVACVVIAGCFVAVAPASAATQIGQTSASSPAFCSAGLVAVQDSTGAPPLYSVPAGGGVITSWSYQSDSAGQTVELKVFRRQAASQYLIVGQSAIETMASGANTFATRMPVQEGDLLGLYTPSGGNCSFRTANAGDVSNGQDSSSSDPAPAGSVFTAPYYTRGSTRMNISANVEPDADKDGFGDETQDGCPTNASTQGACPAATPPAPPTPTPTPTPTPPAVVTPPDTIKPVLGALSMSSSVFQAAGSGPAFTARVGTKVSFTLSEPGSVKFTVQRKTRGRRVAGRCRPQTTANRTKPACTRWVNVRGSFTVPAKKGTNKFTFRGRIGGKKLKPATYRLNSRATDKSGNKSALKRKSFRIVK